MLGCAGRKQVGNGANAFALADQVRDPKGSPLGDFPIVIIGMLNLVDGFRRVDFFRVIHRSGSMVNKTGPKKRYFAGKTFLAGNTIF